VDCLRRGREGERERMRGLSRRKKIEIRRCVAYWVVVGI